MEISLNPFHAGRQDRGLAGVADQRAYAKTALNQLSAESLSDKSGSAGDGDEAAIRDQAEATLRRTSSVTALRRSSSCAAIKSWRALERDSLPEDVRGSECGGTSST